MTKDSGGPLPARGPSGYYCTVALLPFTGDPPEPRLRLVPTGEAAAEMARAAAEESERLVQAFEQGRPGAGAELYDRLFPVVDSTLIRILGRREQDHPDLVQSTFEQIVVTLSRRTFARSCSLAGWAAAIACHVGLNALRSRRRERGVLDGHRTPDDADVSKRAATMHPERQLGARDELAIVRRHLADMAPDRVTTLLLHAMGYDLAEIARLTRTSVAAAQSRLSRARREVCHRLDEAASVSPDSPAPGRRP